MNSSSPAPSESPRTRSALVAIFQRMAELLELRGENPFRCRAYENAARVLEEVEGDPPEWIAKGSLKGLKGVGKGIADHVAEFAATGTIAEFDAVRAEIPEGLLAMAEIPGLGAKKIRALWQDRDITDVAALETACREGSVATMPGFGEKTAAKILAGIEQRRSYSGRHRFDVARAEADAMLARLRALPGVVAVEVAGSLRRRRETIKDIDFVVAAEGAPEDTTTAPGAPATRPEVAAAIMDAFVGAPRVQRVVAHGATKSSVLLESGVPADLRVVAPEQFAATLAYFTGSKEHNTRLRGRAKKMGMKLNEYGLFREGEEAPLPTPDEPAIYRALGLAYVEPEMREDVGEVDAAEAAGPDGALPRLVTRDDLRLLLHCHTTWSDGKNTLDEMVAAARAAGYECFGVCDHSRSAAYAGGLSVERVAAQRAEIDAMNARFERDGDPFRVLAGIESDILADGSLDYDDETLARFDFVVASVHSRFNLSRGEMTMRVVRAIEHPATTILGHPTGRLLLEREPYEIDLDEVFRAAAKHGVAIEINASPWRLDLDWRYIRRAKAAGCKFAIDPDAHSTGGIRDNEIGAGIARKGGLEPADVVNCLSVGEFRKFARKGG